MSETNRASGNEAGAISGWLDEINYTYNIAKNVSTIVTIYHDTKTYLFMIFSKI